MNIDHQSLRALMARILRAGGANEDEATYTFLNGAVETDKRIKIAEIVP